MTEGVVLCADLFGHGHRCRQQISSTTAELSSVSKRLKEPLKMQKEAQLAESELLMTKTRLADAEPLDPITQRSW
ncbi:unnamed protein product, partial [Durusdinium trenchii]